MLLNKQCQCFSHDEHRRVHLCAQAGGDDDHGTYASSGRMSHMLGASLSHTHAWRCFDRTMSIACSSIIHGMLGHGHTSERTHSCIPSHAGG